jgi:hypothetical protein
MKGKWLPGKLKDEPYEIACLMGAFYFTSKSYYTSLHGWDTIPGVRYSAHTGWGHLEPYISLKSWLYGGGCTMYPDIEAGHVFARVTRSKKWDKGARSASTRWFNALFILETMVLDSRIKESIYNHIIPERNYNHGKHMIKANWGKVVEVRERNRVEFKNDLSIFTEKFGYKFD